MRKLFSKFKNLQIAEINIKVQSNAYGRKKKRQKKLYVCLTSTYVQKAHTV